MISTVDYNKKQQLDSVLVSQAQLGDKLAFDHLMQKYLEFLQLLSVGVRYYKHNPKSQRLCVMFSLSSPSAICLFSEGNLAG